MGSFDTVTFLCPNCGSKIEEQSKAGDCELKNYSPSTAPPKVAADLIGESVWCDSCKRSYTIAGVAFLIGLEPVQLR